VTYDEWQDVWARTLNVNVVGAANVCYCAGHWMKQNNVAGSIIHVGSRGAFR
jgi:NAD(P)-dependent dehydrogenase (short-subunit alcohol dehydrogenase family)